MAKQPTIPVDNSQIVETQDAHLATYLGEEINSVLYDGLDENGVVKRLNELVRNLTKPGYLNEAEAGVIQIARSDVEEVLRGSDSSSKVKNRLKKIQKALDKAMSKKVEGAIQGWEEDLKDKPSALVPTFEKMSREDLSKRTKAFIRSQIKQANKTLEEYTKMGTRADELQDLKNYLGVLEEVEKQPYRIGKKLELNEHLKKEGESKREEFKEVQIKASIAEFDQAIKNKDIKKAQAIYMQIAEKDMSLAAKRLSRKLNELNEELEEEMEQKTHELKNIYSIFKSGPDRKEKHSLKELKKKWGIDNAEHYSKVINALDRGQFNTFFRATSAVTAINSLPTSKNQKDASEKLKSINAQIENIKSAIHGAIIQSASLVKNEAKPEPAKSSEKAKPMKKKEAKKPQPKKKSIEKPETLESMQAIAQKELYKGFQTEIRRIPSLRNIFMTDAAQKDKELKAAAKKALVSEFGRTKKIELPKNFLNAIVLTNWLLKVGAKPRDLKRLERRIAIENSQKETEALNRAHHKEHDKMELKRKFTEALEDSDIYSADIFLQDMEKIDAKKAEEMKRELDEFKSEATFEDDEPTIEAVSESTGLTRLTEAVKRHTADKPRQAALYDIALRVLSDSSEQARALQTKIKRLFDLTLNAAGENEFSDRRAADFIESGITPLEVQLMRYDLDSASAMTSADNRTIRDETIEVDDDQIVDELDDETQTETFESSITEDNSTTQVIDSSENEVTQVFETTEEDAQEASNSAPETGNLEEKINSMVEGLLNSDSLKKSNLPVMGAIHSIVRRGIQNGNFTLEELGRFLRNPDFLNKNINFERIKEEMGTDKEVNDITIEDYKSLDQKLSDEMDKIEMYLESIKGQRMSNQTDSDKRQQSLERRMTIKRLKREIAAAIGDKSNNMKYDSPRDILGLIRVYMYKEGEGSVDEIDFEMYKEVANQRKALESGWGATFSKIANLAKPKLKSTLIAIGEDVEFSNLGENPGQKLAELSKAKIPEGVDKWLASIGGVEKNFNGVIPRLIAYLEASVREGKSTSLLRSKKAHEIILHLRYLQKKHLRNKINAMSGKTPREKMMLYLEELRKLSHHETEINEKLIKGNVLKTGILKGALTAGIGAGAVGATMVSFPVVAGAMGALGVSGIVSSYMKQTSTMDEKSREGLRRGSWRAAVAGTLGMAGSIVALPLGISLAGLSVVAPSLGKKFWKHKNEIGKGTGKALGTGASVAVKTALFAAKYMSPLGVYFIPRAIKRVIKR